MLSIVSVTSSVPSPRGSISSGATALCKSYLLRPSRGFQNPREKQFLSSVIVSRLAQPAGEEKPDPGRLSSRPWEEAGLATLDPGGSGCLEVSRSSPVSGQRPGQLPGPARAPYRGRALGEERGGII